MKQTVEQNILHNLSQAYHKLLTETGSQFYLLYTYIGIHSDCKYIYIFNVCTYKIYYILHSNILAQNITIFKHTQRI